MAIIIIEKDEYCEDFPFPLFSSKKKNTEKKAIKICKCRHK